MTNPTPFVGTAPLIRNQRYFPDNDIKALSSQVDQAYIDIAGKINLRTIGIFTQGVVNLTGETWYFSGQPNTNQAYRQVYLVTGLGNIPHGLNPNTINYFSKCTGYFADGTNSYGLIFASDVAIAGQVSFYITASNIVVIAGAEAPNIVKGLITLEWVSYF
jgi:hypothetical protein